MSLPAITPVPDAPKTALVVDDEPEIRELIGQILKAKQIEPVFAATVQEAMEHLKSRAFGLCITDIKIPGGNGLLVAKQIRSMPQHKATPIFVISGNYSLDDLKKVEAAFHNCGVMAKPVRAQEISEIIALCWTDLTDGSQKGQALAESTDAAEAESEDAPAAAANRRPAPQLEPLPEGTEPAYDLQIDHDELEVRLVSCARHPNSFRGKDAVMSALNEEKVSRGIDAAAIAGAFVKLPAIKQSGIEIVIAKGKRAIHGKHGHIDFKVDVSGEASYRAEEQAEAGAVDYREAVSIVMVNEGDLLAEIIPPTEGEDGFSLTGKVLQAKKGKPAILRTGEGVQADDDEKFYYATQQGRPLFTHAVLTVSAVYEVSGDVDFATGNIRFNGHVIVHGGVQDDFAICCKSAEIYGIIGASRIECEDFLNASGGIAGRDKSEIVVGGQMMAKYVSQAQLTVTGDMTVSRDMVNSRVWSLGKVKAGKIVGGNCVALLGIETKVAGSELGVHTTLQPGINYQLLAIDEEMQQLDDEITALVKPVTTFFGDRARYKALPPEKKTEYAGIFEEFLKKKERHDELSAKRREIINSSSLSPVKEVIVWDNLYPDVIIRTGSCMRHFKTEFKGPLAMIEDIERGTLRPATYVPGKGVVADQPLEEGAEPSAEA